MQMPSGIGAFAGLPTYFSRKIGEISGNHNNIKKIR